MIIIKIVFTCLLIAAAIAITGLVIFTAQTFPPTQAQTLSKDKPIIALNGSVTNLTADQEDVDIAIHPYDTILSASGTETIPTEGATDIDINEIPPPGITVIIQNQTVTVTKNPVTIGKD